MTRKLTILVIPIVGFLLMLGQTFYVEGGQAEGKNIDERSVSDGVYTAAQARRGKAEYETMCQSCHGADLSGTGARPLAGEAFQRSWSGARLDSLFNRLLAMPPGAESSLGERTYLDILSYLLDRNGFPAGKEELETEVLDEIVIEGKHGPEPVAEFALVQIVGCLTRSSENGWVVTDATPPVRSRDPAASTDVQLKEVQARALGTLTFQLMNVYPDPQAYEGHKVEAKGFLIRNPVDRINVTALQSLAPACGN